MKKLVSRFGSSDGNDHDTVHEHDCICKADAPKGTLTVNNTVAGKTLDLYQIFTATKKWRECSIYTEQCI